MMEREEDFYLTAEQSPPVAFLMDKFQDLGPQLCYEILEQVGWDIKKAMEVLGVQLDDDAESVLSAQLASLSVTSFDSLPQSSQNYKSLSKSSSKSPVPSPRAPPSSPTHQLHQQQIESTDPPEGENEWKVSSSRKRKTPPKDQTPNRSKHLNPFSHPLVLNAAEGNSNSTAVPTPIPPKWNNYDPNRIYRSGSKNEFIKGLKEYLEFPPVKKVLCVISPLISTVEMKTLVIMRGFPGSGKSHLASILFDASANAVILSADDYFMEGNEYRFNPKALPAAHDRCKERCEAEMKKSTGLIIIDNTNTQLWEFVNYVKLALMNDYYVQLLEPETSWKENLTILASKNVHGVPKDAIRRMIQRYERMTLAAVLREASGGKMETQPQEERVLKKCESVTLRHQGQIKSEIPKSPSWKRIFNSTESSPEKPTTMLNPNFDEIPDRPKQPIRVRTEKEIDEEALMHLNDIKAVLQGEDPPSLKTGFKLSRDSLNSPSATDGAKSRDEDPIDKPGESLFELKPRDFESPYWKEVTKKDKTSDSKCANHKYERNGGAACLNFDEFEDELLGVGGAVGGPSRTFRPIDEDLEVQYDEDEDQRVMTPDINYFEDGAVGGNFSSSFEHLYKLFPLVPRAELSDIYDKCNGDLNWSMDILLENGYAMDNSVPIIPPHLNTPAIESPSAASYQQKKSVKFSENPVQMTHGSVPGHLNPVAGFESPGPSGASAYKTPGSSRQLVESQNKSFLGGAKDDELFEVIDGSDWFNLDISKDLVTDLLNSYSNPFPSLDFNSLTCSQRRIKVPPKLGFKIYKLFILNILQKMMDGWEDADATTDELENEAFDIYSPYEDFEHSNDEKRDIEENLIKNELYAFKLSISPPDLKKIMELETRLNKLECEKAASRRNEIHMTLARKLALGKLKSGFPTLHASNVEEIFKSNGGKYDATLRTLIAIHKDHYKPEAISDTFFGANILMKEAIDKELSALTESTSEYTGQLHDVEEMQHYELRLRALRHSELKKQYEVKSYESLKSSLPGVASYYSQMARLHAEKMREANRLAAKRLYDDYMRKNPDTTKLDLHFFYVTEAIDYANFFLWSKYNQMVTKGLKRVDVKIITGKGNNSDGGIPKIEPAIHDLLRKHNYAFVRMNGYFNVNLWLTKPPFSDYYKANDGQVRKLKAPFH